MIARLVRLHVDQAHVEAFEQQATATTGDPALAGRGVLRFELLRSAAAKGEYLIYELYSDRQALAARLETVRYKDWDAAMAPMMVAGSAASTWEVVPHHSYQPITLGGDSAMERRTSAPEDRLVSLLTEGASAYVETLAAAESAVNQGRFALAKILRAGGYALRVNAVLAARRLSEAAGARDLLQRLDERLKAVRALAAGSEAGALGQRQMDSLGNIISRSIRSLQEHGDVLERDVAQTLWVCYACGHVAESQQPTLCPECGAPAADLEACGPFYVDTPEHLGRLQPSQIGPLLASIPDAIAKTTAGCSEVLLAAKPEEDLWSVKEILAHMGEVDALFQRRLRLLLQSDSVADITGGTIPPWRLQESSGFERETFPALLVAFKEQRASTMREVDRLSAGDWSRFGRRGNSISTVLDLGRWLANHDRGHLEEMKRVLDRLSTSQAAAPPSS